VIQVVLYYFHVKKIIFELWIYVRTHKIKNKWTTKKQTNKQIIRNSINNTNYVLYISFDEEGMYISIVLSIIWSEIIIVEFDARSLLIVIFIYLSIYLSNRKKFDVILVLIDIDRRKYPNPNNLIIERKNFNWGRNKETVLFQMSLFATHTLLKI